MDNRIRLLIEVTEALIGVAGADRTGVRLSPNDDPQGCGDSDSESLFCRRDSPRAPHSMRRMPRPFIRRVPWDIPTIRR